MSAEENQAALVGCEGSRRGETPQHPPRIHVLELVKLNTAELGSRGQKGLTSDISKEKL